MDKTASESVHRLVKSLLYAQYPWEKETIQNGLYEAGSQLDTAASMLQACLQTGATFGKDFNLDIVYCAAYTIKKYYMGSGNPRQMRGASQLLNDIFEKHTPQYLSKNHLEECLCYQGGSQMLAIVPSGCGMPMANHMEHLFERYCITACGAAVALTVKASALLADEMFGTVYGNLLEAFHQRRMLKYDVRPEAALVGDTKKLLDEHKKFTIEKGDNNRESYVKPCTATTLRCHRCRLHTPTYRAQTSVEGVFELCTSCAHKEIRGGYWQRDDFRKRCARFCCDHPEEFHAMTLAVDETFRTTYDLKDNQGDIALLYADVNNLGGAGEALKGLRSHAAFFKAVAETVKKAVFRSLIRAMLILPEERHDSNKLTARFEIIAMGGDDICVLLPGEAALYMATQLALEFESIWEAEHLKDFEPSMGHKAHLSISVGVSVGRYTTPLAFMQSSTEQLLSSAKKRARQQTLGGIPPYSAVDILSLDSDAQWATELAFLREGRSDRNPLYKEGAKMTMRPFTVLEADDFLTVLASAKAMAPHMLHTIDMASKTLAIEEGKLFFEYYKSKMERLSSQKFQKLLIQIRDMLINRLDDASETGMYFGCKEPISPWHDILDLLDQKGGPA